MTAASPKDAEAAGPTRRQLLTAALAAGAIAAPMINELVRRGHTDADIVVVLGGNFRRLGAVWA